MKKEKSCGAIIYKIVDYTIYYLILHMSLGHYSLCKGHVEGNENEVETAIREIKEETNLDVKLDTNFKEIITYSPFENIIKDVIFFVAETKNDNRPVDLHDNEVDSQEFLPYLEAYKKLTYQSDKDVLYKANLYILKKISR